MMMNWPESFVNQVHCADSFEFMKLIPDGVIDMCITSPPYWGLRDYGIEQIFSDGWKGQLGLEPTPEMYIEHLTEIFNEVKRVLKKEGKFWLNIGDTYWGGKGRSAHGDPERHIKRLLEGKTINKPYQEIGSPGEIKPGDGKHDFIQAKSLCMIPERLAWSLIQDGWILRNKIIWFKRNSMPSSVKDRFSNRYEFVYMFSKGKKYYFDLDAVREPYMDSTFKRVNQNEGNPKWDGDHKRGSPQAQHTLNPKQFVHPQGKNPGDVWIIPTQPCPVKGIHFATFPEELCRKAIIPGCPEEVCKKCGKARERIIEAKGGAIGKSWHNHKKDLQRGNRAIKEAKGGHGYHRVFLGYKSCKCNAGFEPGIVLDPFAGIGTAGYVARKLGRRFIMIDIKPEYCEKAENIRLAQGVL